MISHSEASALRVGLRVKTMMRVVIFIVFAGLHLEGRLREVHGMKREGVADGAVFCGVGEAGGLTGGLAENNPG